MNARRTVLALALSLTVAVPAHADFSSLARAVSRRPGVHRMWIPFLGLARVVIWIVEPKGINDFQLVTFRGKGLDDGAAIHELMRRHVEPGFRPLVQARGRNGDWTFIYARPGKADRVELIVFARDHDDETVLVRLDVDADEAMRTIHQHRHREEIARR